MNYTIYTSNIGNYDKYREDILCFKSYDKFKYNRLNAKIFKILYYNFINTEYSIWIDCNLYLKIDPIYLINSLKEYDICVIKHKRRNCLYQEAETCKRANLDYKEIIDNQINKYRNYGFPENMGLAECSLIIRKDNERTRNFCNLWWSEICCGSWRDQISFPFVASKSNARIKYLSPNIKSFIYYKENHLKSRTYKQPESELAQGSQGYLGAQGSQGYLGAQGSQGYLGAQGSQG